MSPDELTRILNGSDLIWNIDQIESALDEMAIVLNRRDPAEVPLVLCVMNGALFTTAYLTTRLSFSVEVDYLHVTRYRGTTEGGQLDWLSKPRVPLKGRDVILVDDIFDEGYTLSAIYNYCQAEGARDVYTAVLVNKVHERKVEGFSPDLMGLEVDDRYVFGFGMDYQGYFRNLPGIYAVT